MRTFLIIVVLIMCYIVLPLSIGWHGRNQNNNEHEQDPPADSA